VSKAASIGHPNYGGFGRCFGSFFNANGQLPGGGNMAVKILIKRTIPENRVQDLMPFFKQLRALATNQSGYISGETLKRIDRPGQYLVISTWESKDDWRRWVMSQKRKEIQDMIDSMLGQETDYEIYEYAS
jgi:heme-degrading monooxygenase HmoA